MAYYNPNCGFPISAFTSIPPVFITGSPGIMTGPPANVFGPGQFRFWGDDLPRVDPFNYPGEIRFGPSYTIIGPHLPDVPLGNGIFDPNLIVPQGVGVMNIPLQYPFMPM